MVKIGWPFDIPAKSSRPADSSVQTGYSDEFVFSPKPFQADFVLRSHKHKAVILQSMRLQRLLLQDMKTELKASRVLTCIMSDRSQL